MGAKYGVIVGWAELDLLLPGSNSLKDKRQVLRSLLERLRNRFNLAAAEVSAQEQWSRAVIGLACVSNDHAHARQILDEAIRFVEGDGRCEITRRQVDVI